MNSKSLRRKKIFREKGIVYFLVHYLIKVGIAISFSTAIIATVRASEAGFDTLHFLSSVIFHWIILLIIGLPILLLYWFFAIKE